MYDQDCNSGEDGRPTPDEFIQKYDPNGDFELVYQNGGHGGHGGPYHGFENAVQSAKDLLEGCRTIYSILVVPRTAPLYHYKYKVATVRRNETMISGRPI